MSVGPGAWVAFVALVLALVALDLGWLQRDQRAPSRRAALVSSVGWIGLACLFGGWIGYSSGAQRASEYFTAYVVEKSLSVDNLFVILLVFAAMKIPEWAQHRVLRWGIVGALVLRGAMIFVGTALLERFHWLIYVFGALLIYTGVQILREWRKGDASASAPDRLVSRLRQLLPMSESLDGHRFFTRQAGSLLATPLFGALVVIELSDVVFAVDSIPAALAISDDAFIVYTSNVFALLGLRSLYFLLAGVLQQMQELKLGLAAVLVFVGFKMALADVFHVPPFLALAIIAVLLTIPPIVALVRRTRAARVVSTAARDA